MFCRYHLTMLHAHIMPKLTYLSKQNFNYMNELFTSLTDGSEIHVVFLPLPF
jgi:hypothetical protein